MNQILQIDAFSLKQKLDKKEVILIDVREFEEYIDGYIEGAELINLKNVSIDTVKDKKLPIVFYCRAGVRSELACSKMIQEGSNLSMYSLTGGINAWQNAGFSVLKK